MSNSAPPHEAVSVIAQEFLVDEPCALSVSLPAAHAHLRPGPHNDRLEVDISVAGCPPAEAEKILDRMQVGTHQMKDTVQVYSDGDRSGPEWWRWIRTLDVSIHVDLRLPSRVDAEIEVPGGGIDIAGLRGSMDLRVTSGPCRVQDLVGTLDVRAESSDVSIQGFSGEQVDARVAVGSLTMEDIDADTITAQSVAGPLNLSTVKGPTTVTAKSAPVDLQDLSGPCTAHVQGGHLTFGGAPTQEIDLHAVGTTLHATLPPDHDADLTMRGPRLSLDDAFSFEGERTPNEIEGTLNDGGPPLSLEATGGRIQCRSA